MAKILIIEDMFEIRMMIRSFLERKGHAVTDAQNGDEALERLSSDNPEVIITDLLMPGKDGLGTIKELRNKGLKTPIIIVTGYEEPISQEDAKQYGITKILMKPFSSDELVKAVEHSLGMRETVCQCLH
ncbi:MAG: response regulator [bacterium]